MWTTIRVKRSTKERLMKHGRMGETFDQLLNRILDAIEKRAGERASAGTHLRAHRVRPESGVG